MWHTCPYYVSLLVHTFHDIIKVAMERKWCKTHQIMPLIKPDHAFDKRFNTRHIGFVHLADVMALLSPTYSESSAFVSPWVHTFGLPGQDECETAGWAQWGLMEVARDCLVSLNCGLIEARKICKDNEGIGRYFVFWGHNFIQFPRTDKNRSIQVRHSKWRWPRRRIGCDWSHFWQVFFDVQHATFRLVQLTCRENDQEWSGSSHLLTQANVRLADQLTEAGEPKRRGWEEDGWIFRWIE